MRFVRQEKMQCSAIVTPGEYVLDIWDNKRCTCTNPWGLMRCDYCDKLFCLGMHYPKHIEMEWKRDEETNSHNNGGDGE